MTRLFAVHGGPSIYAIVKAETNDEAFDVFAKSQINDQIFREHVDYFSVNANLLEDFYLDEEGSFFDSETGSLRKDLLNLNENDCVDYINRCIEENARRFWNDAPQIAEEYLSELFKERETNRIEPALFSEDFYVDTFKRIVKDGQWYDEFEIVEVDLSEDGSQIIYRS
ncbi:hypothetical protein [Bacillus swezeyi]|uniref:Uncharacterized protein n=1 Tax=Bacillus swezeyi TaxID=1925020 RepID=A0A5M8RHQ1_9BACI|nr:hypothetical protein [Bacillus swezeyi]KAA6446978.1 hypothetical protein DX927_23320 [Bacillus swezeyi]KAA6471546.1 hypothetical protein DX928_23560 [Bacillus swezeyi]